MTRQDKSIKVVAIPNTSRPTFNKLCSSSNDALIISGIYLLFIIALLKEQNATFKSRDLAQNVVRNVYFINQTQNQVLKNN